jgi:hypothetical protein
LENLHAAFLRAIADEPLGFSIGKKPFVPIFRRFNGKPIELRGLTGAILVVSEHTIEIVPGIWQRDDDITPGDPAKIVKNRMNVIQMLQDIQTKHTVEGSVWKRNLLLFQIHLLIGRPAQSNPPVLRIRPLRMAWYFSQTYFALDSRSVY